MKTKILVFLLDSFSENNINKDIKALEDIGFIATDTKIAAGNKFSKYTCHPTVVITMQKWY